MSARIERVLAAPERDLGDGLRVRRALPRAEQRAVGPLTAGSGIVHSERSPGEARAGGAKLFGMQTWVALPDEHEEVEPCFAHHGAVPELDVGDARVALILGSLRGERSPVDTLSPILYAAVDLPAPGGATLPIEAEEAALYVASGSVAVGDAEVGEGDLALLSAGSELHLRTEAPARRFAAVPGDDERMPHPDE